MIPYRLDTPQLTKLSGLVFYWMIQKKFLERRSSDIVQGYPEKDTVVVDNSWISFDNLDRWSPLQLLANPQIGRIL